MKINKIKALDAWAVDADIDAIAHTLRLTTPMGNFVWYKFTMEGFEVIDTKAAIELEAAFQEIIESGD